MSQEPQMNQSEIEEFMAKVDKVAQLISVKQAELERQTQRNKTMQDELGESELTRHFPFALDNVSPPSHS